MKIPGPDHPISIAPNPKRVVVRANGGVLADTNAALTLAEASYPHEQYVPRADVDMSQLVRADHATTCPFKGEASYYSLKTDDGIIENCVWSYETPHDAVAQIKEHLAFYPQRVESIQEIED